VWLEYGRDRSYGDAVEAEIRELLTHVPVWDGRPGLLKASRTLNADQFFVHAHLRGLAPGTQYHYRFRYASGPEQGATPDAAFMTAPGEAAEPFTFTAFADEGIPGPSLDQDPSLLPESDWGMWNNGSFDATDPDSPVTAGTAGTPRYAWAGAHETDRNFAAGKGSGTMVAGDAKTQTGPYVSELDFSERFETADWSQARYADYGFVALDVTPAPPGQRTTIVLRFINEQGRELDRVVFSRTAGEGPGALA
jgi:hypothetical protein